MKYVNLNKRKHSSHVLNTKPIVNYIYSMNTSKTSRFVLDVCLTHTSDTHVCIRSSWVL